MTRVISWTKSRAIAQLFASEGNGSCIAGGDHVLGGGFIHILHGSVVGVDVEQTLQKLKKELIQSDEGDELRVAKREREVLLLRGVVITPVRRKGRVFEWMAIA